MVLGCHFDVIVSIGKSLFAQAELGREDVLN
jgi:hypothetical protein